MELEERLKAIKLIIYDFDGVMTDNKVILDQNGTESVIVNRSDGYGVSCIKKLNIEQIIISTETNPVVKRRAEKLKIDIIHGVGDKGQVVSEYIKNKGYDAQQVMFIGNDLNDMPALKIVGIAGAPRDAEEEVLQLADWISSKNGGDGVIRDLYRLLTSIR